MTNVDYKSIKNAHKRIKRYIAETPLITSREINKNVNNVISKYQFLPKFFFLLLTLLFRCASFSFRVVIIAVHLALLRFKDSEPHASEWPRRGSRSANNYKLAISTYKVVACFTKQVTSYS